MCRSGITITRYSHNLTVCAWKTIYDRNCNDRVYKLSILIGSLRDYLKGTLSNGIKCFSFYRALITLSSFSCTFYNHDLTLFALEFELRNQLQPV